MAKEPERITPSAGEVAYFLGVEGDADTYGYWDGKRGRHAVLAVIDGYFYATRAKVGGEIFAFPPESVWVKA